MRDILKVQRSQNESNSWNGMAHFLRVQSGRNEVSIESVTHGMLIRTS